MSTAPPGADYQVFLSFRGPDTRQGFADCLYHFMVDAGIRVFRDSEGIPAGEKIEVILRAINGSIVCIPIFSKGYASSKWCLRELAEMVELKKKIMPVFYDVTPDDVKLKTPLYRDAMTNHGKEEEEEEEEKWGKALEKALEISGWESSKDREEKALRDAAKIKGWELNHLGYVELCKSIVKVVLVNLKVKHKVVTDHLVGMHERVETVLKYLDIQAPEVRYIGIFGLGGSGKTTLAKVVFNKLSAGFDACSFLANVRESSINGVAHLQKKLICDLHGKYLRDISDADDGIKTIKDMCRNKKVLIVLDDVDSREQIESLAGRSNRFTMGSRIIITTRDIGVLAVNQEGLEQDQNIKEVQALDMGEMDFGYALQLFSRHAFKMDFPPPEYVHLSKEVVSATGRLPLTLEIIGSHLYGKSIHEWEDKRNTLIRIPPKDIQKRLMMSYEGLDFRTKQIFLDIACFTFDLEIQNAIYMWRSCGFRPETGLEELISKSLVKFHDDKFWMHDHLRDLGREIICMENFMDLGERSRLCNQKEAFGTLLRKEGTKKIEVLHLSGDDVKLEDFSLTCEDLRNLRNLRYLSLGKLSLLGDFEHLFSKLRWLSWNCVDSRFKATNLNLEQLAVLDLSRSCVSDLWEGWSQIKVGDQLAVLDLSHCEISQTPDLSKFGSLERLILERCFRLSQIDSSIGNLMWLKHLNLKACESLKGLPEEICSLIHLEEIFLNGSHHTFNTLPESIGDLKSLSVFELDGVHLTHLPRSIGGLHKLKRLSLSFCQRLVHLPDTIGNARSLVELDLSGTSISELPNSLGDPDKDTHLERLILDRCWNLKKIGSSISKLKSLKQLTAENCRSLRVLAEEIGCVEALEELNLGSCDALPELPRTVGKLRKLKRLSLKSCFEIQELPEAIADVESLTELDLSGTRIGELPNSFGGLKKLECLRLRGCRIKKLPDSFGELKMLHELDMSASSICELPNSFGGLTRLRRLSLRNCGYIKKLPESFGELKSLSELDISFSALDELPGSFWDLKGLKVEMEGCNNIRHDRGLQSSTEG